VSPYSQVTVVVIEPTGLVVAVGGANGACGAAFVTSRIGSVG
jgi:hypothetical protein